MPNVNSTAANSAALGASGTGAASKTAGPATNSDLAGGGFSASQAPGTNAGNAAAPGNSNLSLNPQTATPQYNLMPVNTPQQANPGTMTSVAPVNFGSVTAAQAGPSTYDPSKANSARYGANNAGAAQWQVDPNQLTSNQLNGILQSNSPLMGQASLAADQAMAGRGLLNSSMTGGAEEAAMINAATPIAQSNAQTLAAAAAQNTQNTQQTNLANQGAQNTAAQFNAGNEQQIALANQTAANTAGQFNAGQTQQAAQTNQAATNTANQFNAQGNLTAAQSNQGTALQQATTTFNAALQTAMQATGGQITLAQQTLAANSAGTVAQLQGQFSNLMTSNQAVASSFNQLQSSIAAILANPAITNPQVEISKLTNTFTNYADAMQAVSNLPISSYFQSPSPSAPATGTQGAQNAATTQTNKAPTAGPQAGQPPVGIVPPPTVPPKP